MEYAELIENGTSVKSIGIIERPTAEKSGICDFIYRNVYSVFDWGQMPMPEGKIMDNRPVAVVAAFNYEMIKKLGFPVCYIGCANSESGKFSKYAENLRIIDTIRLKMVNIIKPRFDSGTKKWDYLGFSEPSVNNYVHPVEFIWRAEAGPDSSFWKNIEKGAYNLADFGLPDDLKPGNKFPSPILDHSSKYEDHDRYFAPKVARALANISKARWGTLNYMRHIINHELSKHAKEVGIYRPDGKQEFCVISDNGNAVDYLADVAGTWHEDRFEYTTKDGRKVKVSKQTPRDLNKLLNAEWAKQCDDAKKRAEKEGLPNWKELVTLKPKPLEPEFFDQYNNLMYAATDAWTGRTIFGHTSLEEACVEFDKYLKDYKARLEKRN